MHLFEPNMWSHISMYVCKHCYCNWNGWAIQLLLCPCSVKLIFNLIWNNWEIPIAEFENILSLEYSIHYISSGSISYICMENNVMQPRWSAWKSYDQLEWEDLSSYTQTKSQADRGYRTKTRNKVIGSKRFTHWWKIERGREITLSLKLQKKVIWITKVQQGQNKHVFSINHQRVLTFIWLDE